MMQDRLRLTLLHDFSSLVMIDRETGYELELVAYYCLLPDRKLDPPADQKRKKKKIERKNDMFACCSEVSFNRAIYS